jgi:two-component system chemotaxis response regulator CheY
MTKILIADDTQFMRTNLRIIFERNGMQVIAEADSGSKAIKMYEQFKPDIVTMDITMPNIDGIQATKHILKMDPKAKIIIISTLGQENFVRDSILAGAKNFIVKPFTEYKVIDVEYKVLEMKV